MKALIWQGPNEMAVGDVPEPGDPGPNELILRAEAVGHNINDPVGRLIGHHGKAVAAFAGREGRVFVDGKEWAAALDGAEALAAGNAVEVTGVSGARLTVRPAR